MAIPNNIADLEKDKFVDDGSGNTAVRTTATLSGASIPNETDDSAFTIGTDTVSPIGLLADETTPDSVDEGDVGLARMTLDRRAIPATGAKDDAAFTAGDYVSQTGYIADEAATDSVDEGDVGIARMTLNRRTINAGQFLDDSAYGVGTDYVNATGLLADETATDSVDEGDVGAARMTLDRRAITAGNILDDAAFGIGTGYVTPTGLLADEASTDSVDEGDVGLARMTLDRKTITSQYAHTAGGADPYWDADGDNTAQALKASAGTLYKLNIYNSNSSEAYIQLFNTAAGSVTVGTTTPVYVARIPANGQLIEDFGGAGLGFSTAITYACTTTSTGSGAPATGLEVSGVYK